MLKATIRTNNTIRGSIGKVRKLAMRWEDTKSLALASSLIASRISKVITAMPKINLLTSLYPTK